MITPIPKKVGRTKEFREWQAALKVDKTSAVIDARIKRLQFGNRGDVTPVGDGVSELRIDYGPGWRVYFSEINTGDFVLLLLGGDKSTQKFDIQKAKRILHDLKAKQRQAKAAVRAKGGKNEQS